MSYGYYGWQEDVPAKNALYPGITDQRALYEALKKLWCIETCAPRLRPAWSPDNPSLGQCSISAFLAQDIFGGEVYGLALPGGGVHCFNAVDGKIFDLASEQFGGEKLTLDLSLPQSREAHFADGDKLCRYELLKKLLRDYTGS